MHGKGENEVKDGNHEGAAADSQQARKQAGEEAEGQTKSHVGGVFKDFAIRICEATFPSSCATSKHIQVNKFVCENHSRGNIEQEESENEYEKLFSDNGCQVSPY